MKTLLYIYLGMSVLTYILYIFSVLKISHEFKRRYPNLKAPRKHLIDTIGTVFKITLIHFIPIFNIGLFFVYLFCDEKLEERTIEKLYLKLSKEADDGG
jgi:hypothetical protein